MGLDNTAELVFLETTLVTKLPESISQLRTRVRFPSPAPRFTVLKYQLDGTSEGPILILLCSLRQARAYQCA